MRIPSLLTGVAGLLLVAPSLADDAPQDLGTVLQKTKNLSKYYELIKKYPDILFQLPNYDGITIIAPSDDAFKNIPYTPLNDIWDPEDKDKTVPILQYHVLKGTVNTGDLKSGPNYVKPTLLTSSKYTNVTDGQNVVINKDSEGGVVLTSSMSARCSVNKTDIEFQGGLIQIVDNLLIPPARIDDTAESFKVASFLGSLYAADLMPELADRKNITVFAPQSTAFDAVGGSLEKLDAKKLAAIMGYHVVPDQVLVSSALTNGTKLETLSKGASGGEAASVTVRQAGNNKYVNSAQIVQPDILIANGILHIISDVLNPDAAAVQPDPDIGTQPPVFPVSTAKDVFTSALPCSTDCPVTTTSAMNGTDATNTASAEATSDLASQSSDNAAAPARCTAHVAGAALGVLGVGAGMAWL